MIKSTSCFQFESKSNSIQDKPIKKLLEITFSEPNSILLEHKDLSREKLNILKEIINSEKKYLDDIEEIVLGYYDEILYSKYENNELLSIIFNYLKEILDFTRYIH